MNSFAISPVIKDTPACQKPNPNGINIFEIYEPIEYKKLSSIEQNPYILKLDKNQIIIDIEIISVPIFLKNEDILFKDSFKIYNKEGSL